MLASTAFYVFYFFIWIFSWLPLRVLYLFSDFLFFIVYYLVGYRKSVVLNNLSNAFPQKSKKEIKQISKKFYRHLGDLIIEVIFSLHANEKHIKKRYKNITPAFFEQYYQKKQGVIAVMGHYASWEWLLAVPLSMNNTAIATYKPLSSKHFDKLVNRIRKRFGLHLVSMKKTYKNILAHLKKKEPIITFLVSDQSPPKDEIQYRTNFLNQDTPVLLGVEKIAKKTNQPVIFFKVDKIKRGYYTYEGILITNNPQSEPDYVITEKHVRILEKMIQEKPELWLWSHKRWKHARPNLNS